MPRNTKDSQNREAEEVERDDVAAPTVEDEEVEAEDRTRAKADEDSDEEAEGDDEDLAEDIDLDDLSAMEGPDA